MSLRPARPAILVSLALGLVLATLAVGSSGCAAPEGDSETTASSEDDLKIQGAKYVGRIEPGETKTVRYTDPPLYRAFGFDAEGGDRITVRVESRDGDAVAWIASSRYNTHAKNDDADEYTFDSLVTYTVPAGTPKRSYRIVFRDYARLDATFRVSLDIEGSATSCSYDGQTRAIGASFSATDGCNTCNCTDSGTVACTKMACTCNPEAEPNRNYVGTPDTCMLIRYVCQPGRKMFSNDCGCGCELE